MNLHQIVRGAITAVNPDSLVTYLASTGSTTALGGRVTPTFAAPVNNVVAQIQPVSTQDLRQFEFLSGQGIFRSVYLYGQVNGIDRVAAKGGDLLQFPEVPAGTVRTWLVKAVPEQWGDAGAWCRVIVALQTDPNNP